jgi:hypothetical protein
LLARYLCWTEDEAQKHITECFADLSHAAFDHDLAVGASVAFADLPRLNLGFTEATRSGGGSDGGGAAARIRIVVNAQHIRHDRVTSPGLASGQYHARLWGTLLHEMLHASTMLGIGGRAGGGALRKLSGRGGAWAHVDGVDPRPRRLARFPRHGRRRVDRECRWLSLC